MHLKKGYHYLFIYDALKTLPSRKNSPNNLLINKTIQLAAFTQNRIKKIWGETTVLLFFIVLPREMPKAHFN